MGSLESDEDQDDLLQQINVAIDSISARFSLNLTKAQNVLAY